MDTGGKTRIHKRSCARVACACPTRLAAGTVRNVVGKLRTIFAAHGRVDRENPASLPEVTRYLTFTREEQAAAAAIPRQATPFHPAKLHTLVQYLVSQLMDPRQLPLHRYLLVRDLAFFVVDYFTGDRASDLGRLESRAVFKLTGEGGFLLNFTFGKTLRGAGTLTRPFVLLPAPSLSVCPVFWFQYYLEYCNAMAIALHPGYVFRATTGQRYVSDQPFLGSAVNNRLRSHLIAAGLHEGETPHSFRVGVATTLSALGCSVDDIAAYVGWRSLETARRYSQPASMRRLTAVFATVVDALKTSSGAAATFS